MQNTPAVIDALPDLDDRVRALEAAMRLLEEKCESRFSAQASRIGVLEAHAERFTRPREQTPRDD